MPSTQGALAQAGKGIALCKHRPRCVGGVRSMQQVALFRGEEEEQAVDQTKELLEIVLDRERTVIEGGAHTVVVRMLQEAVSDLAQGFGNAVAKLLQSTFTRLVRFGSPGFDDASG